MPEPVSEPAPATRPRSLPLTELIGDWLARHDPGGIDTNRALHLGASILLAVAFGYAASPWLPNNLDIPFPLMAGAGAVVTILATPAASRAAEHSTFARVFGITTLFMLSLIAIGPGNGPLNHMVQKLALVPWSFTALLLRRYGMDGQRLGIALVIVATVGTILSPTRADAALLLVGLWLGLVTAAGLRRSPWRPSAVGAFITTVLDMQGAVAAFLREMSDQVRNGHPFPAERAEPIERLRLRIWNALANAFAEDPGARPDFEALRVKVYRLRVAVELLASCIPSDPDPAAPWRRPFSAAADHLARWLEDIRANDIHSEERFKRAMEQLRAAAFSPELAPAVRFDLMRAVTAFDRLYLVISGIEATESAPFPPPHPPAPAAEQRLKATPLLATGRDGTRTLSNPLKVALQGALATSITTGLDIGLGLSHAYWATMTVMFVMGNSVGETYVRARYRVVGTLVGVLIGIGYLLAAGDAFLPMVLLGTVAQVISVITARDRYDVSSAAVGFSVVVGLHLVVGLDTEGMLARIYETIIGAVIALVVSSFVLPVYLADQLHPEVKGLLERCRTAFASWWPHNPDARPGERTSVSRLAREVRVLDDRLPHLSAESLFGHSAGDAANVVSTLDVLITYLALIEDNSQRLSQLPQHEGITTAVAAARARTLAAFEATLGESAPDTAAATTPALDAAISTVLDLADEPEVASALPQVADYLAYSDAVIRPIRDLGIALSDQAPWTKERAMTAPKGTPHPGPQTSRGA